MTEKNGFRYLDVLPRVLDSYNDSVHSSTGFAPVRMGTPECYEHREKLTQQVKPVTHQAKYAIEDYVRIRKKRKTFEKGFETNYTDEIFTIVKTSRHPNDITLYTIKDRSHLVIDGQFYEQELSKVIVDENPRYHYIEQVLRTRKRKGVEEYLIRWAGFPAAFDSWEPVKNLNHVPDTSL